MTLQNHKQIMQTDKSKTPRTDDQIGYKGATMSYVSIDFARTLERELTAKDAELAELRGMYEGMKDCQKNANEAAREFADAATRAESERDELRAWKNSVLTVEAEWDAQALAKLCGGALGQSCRAVISKAMQEIPELRSALAAERAHADRLAEALRACPSCSCKGCKWCLTCKALTAHEARRKGGGL